MPSIRSQLVKSEAFYELARKEALKDWCNIYCNIKLILNYYRLSLMDLIRIIEMQGINIERRFFTNNIIKRLPTLTYLRIFAQTLEIKTGLLFLDKSDFKVWFNTAVETGAYQLPDNILPKARFNKHGLITVVTIHSSGVVSLKGINERKLPTFAHRFGVKDGKIVEYNPIERYMVVEHIPGLVLGPAVYGFEPVEPTTDDGTGRRGL